MKIEKLSSEIKVKNVITVSLLERCLIASSSYMCSHVCYKKFGNDLVIWNKNDAQVFTGMELISMFNQLKCVCYLYINKDLNRIELRVSTY